MKHNEIDDVYGAIGRLRDRVDSLDDAVAIMSDASEKAVGRKDGLTARDVRIMLGLTEQAFDRALTNVPKADPGPNRLFSVEDVARLREYVYGR